MEKIDPQEAELTVVYFLSPECPLCLNYVLPIREIQQQFGSSPIQFYGVFAKEWYTPEAVNQYKLQHDLDLKMVFETGNELTNTLGATVTPEVFVLSSTSEVQYSGKIDDWVNQLGKKKLEVSEHYLKNALTALLEGGKVNPKRTEPIGCLIE